MILNGKEYDLNTLVKNLDVSSHSFVKVGSIMLTKHEIAVLKRYSIPYEKANSLKDLRIKIEDVMEGEMEDDSYDLECVLDAICERDYYDYKSH